MNPEVRRIRAEDWPQRKAVRLRALADAPEAFSMTLAEGESRTDAEWQSAAQCYSISESETTFLAFDGDEPCGMVGCYLSSENSGPVAYLAAVWVDPHYRGTGIAAALAAATLEWVQSRNVSEVRAWVMEDNHRAKAFYAKAGFIEAETADGEVLMICRLGGK